VNQTDLVVSDPLFDDVPNRLERWGIMYIPDHCFESSSECRLHVNYHGCEDRNWPGREWWAIFLGLNEYAEANNMIILYP
jgi:hypothetical protein